MMILFDGVHMTSTESLEELFEAAKDLGLRRRWLQRSNGGILHFDLFGAKAKALPKNCEGRDIVARGIRGPLPWTNGRQHRSMQGGSSRKAARRCAGSAGAGGATGGEVEQ
jgi:hypothetical protein